MSAEKEQFYDDCSFVSIHYIICECGETFPSENGLRAHLEKEHPHKRERKEFKCGVCGSIFGQEEDCINHYAAQHMDAEVKEEDSSDEDTPPDMEHDITEDMEHEITEEVEYESQELEEGTVLEQVTEETLEDQELQQEDMMEIHMEGGGAEEHGLKLEQVNQEEDHNYVQESHDTQLQEVEHEEDIRAHMVKLEAEEGMSQDEVTQATEMLLKENGTREFPQPKPAPLKMVRDPDTGQLVLVLHRSKPSKPPKKGPPSRIQVHKHIICEVCGRNYASNAALKYHQRVHSGEKPYQCQLCPKSFTMPLFLQIHIRTHTGERPFECGECPKAFSNKAALLRHQRVHTGEKPYLCPMCYKSFTQSNSMKLHVATVHLKQPAPYKSRNRRLKEQNNKQNKQLRSRLQGQTRIKAFAPSQPPPPTEILSDRTASDGEYEVVISEEIEEDPDTCYEIVYTES